MITEKECTAKIVVIEDEADISRAMELNLVSEGYGVTSCANGREGLSLVRREQPDLVLLDLMLPGLNGLEVCRKLRESPATRRIPVIMVTAKGEESDVVLGLGLGAEDYITKPFRINEMLARVRAAFRRREELNQAAAEVEVIRFSGIVLDIAQHTLTVDSRDVPVTSTEFNLLECLFKNVGRVYTRELLISVAIGDDVYVNERTIDSHISTVRRKLGNYRAWLKTIWGVGYRFDPDQQGAG